MAFDVSQKTLESLEWPRVLERMRAACRTPQARVCLTPNSDGEAADPQATGNSSGSSLDASPPL